MPPLALQPAVMLPHEPLGVLSVTEWRFNKQLEDIEWVSATQWFIGGRCQGLMSSAGRKHS